MNLTGLLYSEQSFFYNLKTNTHMENLDQFNWIVPIKLVGGGSNKPQIYISYKYKEGQCTNLKLLINGQWMDQNVPELIKDRSALVFIAFSINREKNEIHLIFNPPRNMPLFSARFCNKSTNSIQLLNKYLLLEISKMYSFHPDANRQYIEIKKFKVINDQQVWVMTHDPKSDLNKAQIAKGKIQK
jgi:hypothetical protein